MIELPKFGNIEAQQRIKIEEEFEQRILAVKNARAYRVDETQEDRSRRIETANYALEDFCTGMLCGIQILKARKKRRFWNLSKIIIGPFGFWQHLQSPASQSHQKTSRKKE